jgi:hypothetical protein
MSLELARTGSILKIFQVVGVLVHHLQRMARVTALMVEGAAVEPQVLIPAMVAGVVAGVALEIKQQVMVVLGVVVLAGVQGQLLLKLCRALLRGEMVEEVAVAFLVRLLKVKAATAAMVRFLSTGRSNKYVCLD